MAILQVFDESGTIELVVFPRSYATMKSLRHARMQEVEIPVTAKSLPNEERLLPFPEQLIQKFNNTPSKRGYLEMP